MTLKDPLSTTHIQTKRWYSQKSRLVSFTIADGNYDTFFERKVDPDTKGDNKTEGSVNSEEKVDISEVASLEGESKHGVFYGA